MLDRISPLFALATIRQHDSEDAVRIDVSLAEAAQEGAHLAQHVCLVR